MLSGRLKLDIYVRADGVVEHIDILEAMDVSGALRESVIPLLKNARFTPALKNGKSVNSIKTIEFDLMARDDPKKTTFSKIPGYLPKQDMYGNIILN